MTTRHLTAALLGLALLTALSACGKKGPLELPPNADTAQAEPAKVESVTDIPGETESIDQRPLEDQMQDISPRNLPNY